MMTVEGARWRLLCEAPNKMEAIFIQGRLQSEGIAVHIVSEPAAELYGITQGSLAVARLYVPEEHLETARALLAADPPPPPIGDDFPSDDGAPH